MSPELSVTIDRLNNLYNEIELSLKGSLLRFENFPISVERLQGKMKLCYNGRPINDCKVDERIEAASYFKQFRTLIEKYSSERLIRAENAEHLLTEFINELHSSIQTGSGGDNQE